jgi:WD40 repeat protein
VWIYDVSRGLRTGLTFDPADDIDPVLSSEGRSIVFRSNRKGHYDLYRKSADAAYDVSADGQRFLHLVAAEQKSAEPVAKIARPNSRRYKLSGLSRWYMPRWMFP